MTKKIINIFFVAAVIALLLAGLAKTIFFPHELNTYENRYAEQIHPFTIDSFLDGSFQSSMDSALADQVHFAQYCKKLYHLSHSAFQKALLFPIAETDPYRYFDLGEVGLYGGTHLTNDPRSFSATEGELSTTVDIYNRYFAALSVVDFYLYFIEKDTDINFETGEKLLAYEYLRDHLDLPADQMDCFSIDSFEQYSQLFYRTDHHWNYLGSYAAYLELLTLLNVSEPPLDPVETVLVSDSYLGSKAYSSGLITLYEPFSAYRFEFPEMEITANGSPVSDYGKQDAFFAGTAGTISYGGFYGGDVGELIFDTGTTGRGSILLIGESYDNAVLKLLASHFDQTYSIDLRYYSTFMGSDFDLPAYLSEHSIDRVLLIGSDGFFSSETFRLEG